MSRKHLQGSNGNIISLHKRGLVWLFILVTLSFFVGGPAAANDAPVINGSTATYSGNQQPDAITQDQTDIYNIIINSLTTNVGSSSTYAGISLTNTGADGSYSGDAGADSQNLSLNYTGGNYYLYGNQFGACVNPTGGNGANGSSSAAGGAGGNGGTVNVQTSGPTSTQPGEYGIQGTVNGIWAGSFGGKGGLGSKGSKNDDGKAGGDGGDGGAVSVTNYASISVSSVTGYGCIVALSGGGGGGDGGTSSSSYGGAGGHGGQSGIVSITNYGAISASDGSAYGIYASSTGGDGGIAFEHEGTGTQKGPAGGNGGDGGTNNSSGVLTGVTISNYGAVNSAGTGIGAYSAGGSGGNGGMGHGSAAYGTTGGNGGAGGAGGAVSVTTNGAVTISGLNSSGTAYGIDARSSGAAGGTGGTGDGDSFPGTGGDGGGGGAGGGVTVTNNAVIDTSQSTAGVDIGINALSTGGNGGQGGTGEGGGESQTGGNGGVGGAGGAVTANCNANITTAGDYCAVIAASIGGNGGMGGTGNLAGNGGDGGGTGPVSVTVAQGVTLTGGIWAASIAGAGGTGGNGDEGNGGNGAAGGAVTVTCSGSINTGTAGAYNNGILAQSWGGAGGAGGTGKTAGSGGQSGVGGTVTVNLGGSIQTATQSSYGILAQSMGGAGGSSGETKGVITHSGWATNGADGGAVTINTGSYAGGAYSSILTQGAGSTAICAQSVGGGGGTGDSTSGVIESIGGAAGSGGAGGAATVNNDSQVTTQGLGAHGIQAQSVGGGGGNGGGTVTGGVGFAIGGSGGDGGAAGQVNVITTGNSIATAGDFAHGILAESLGGGGGNGGYAISGGIISQISIGGSGGSGGAGVEVNVGSKSDSGIITYCTSPISTTGFDSKGIFAQSIGGGGGAGGYSIAAGLASAPIAIGGSGGGGGSGGEVNVYNAGAITTSKDLSQGIFAQSLGGGGGHGGYSFAGNVTPLLSASFSFGGGAGPGGDGEAVTVQNTGTIQTGSTSTQNGVTETHGVNAHGILAQSIGGSGGHGGWAGSGSASFSLPDVPVSVSLALSMGGTGGVGGAGGDVTVNNLAPTEGSSFISTLGDHAYGILAQSIGGGGGAGGGSVAASMSFSGSGSFSMNCPIAIGGSGGAGGAAGVVEVTNQNAIQTSGFDSLGIMAQSVSNGGGDGGVSATFGLSGNPSSTASSVDLNPKITIGGDGGDGSAGNTVTVNNTGAITTTGGFSIGIEAQSVGGIGGNGNWAFAGSMLLGRSNGFNPSVTLGGTGGIGGDGNTVKVTNGQEGYADIGAISTGGFMAHGLLAQSLGGGGGNGGAAATLSLGKAVLLDNSSINLNPTVTVGGPGGVAGHGGEVDVYNYANVTTSGLGAHGIFAQSVGGGGGAGGSSHTINASTSATSGQLSSFNMPSSNITASVAVGGKGGDGSYGGTVNVNNAGQIVTQGFDAYGILAQSIGGSGGAGAAANDFSMILALSQAGNKNNNASGLNINESISVGGNGGNGSYGGAVTVNNSGAIYTSGYNAYGILAQSIGGGGGVGGSSSTGLAVPSSDYNDWSSWLIPSIGQLTFEVGGNGGGSSDGGEVQVNNSGAITTSGHGAFGIYAQSIGGGGGVAHYDQSQMFTDSDSNGGQVSPAILPGTIEIGGKGGAGGDGGTVWVTNGGAISTSGNQASGIYAQSIGGGGGNGSIIGGAWNGISFLQYFGFGLNMGRTGGTGGDGGAVTVTNTANISTQGDNANGIFAHSIGSAGGSGSTSTQFFQGFIWNGSFLGGGGGDGGQVNVSQTGNITTYGADSHGIVAQSTTGTDKSGNVSITLNDPDYPAATPGNIIANGLGSCGIVAQSLGAGGNGNVEITINQPSANTGIVQGGTTGTVTFFDGATTAFNAYGVLVMDGTQNTLTNYGAISTLDGVTGTAIMQQASFSAPYRGDLTINNYGSISGSVNQGNQVASPLNDGSLPTGQSTITFNNYQGGTYNAGPVVNLGGGTLSNGGVLSLGTMHSTLTGNYTQTGTGTFQTTINGDGTIGQLNVSGKANLGGTLQVLAGTGPFQNGTSSPFLTGTISGNFTEVALPAQTSLVGFTVETFAGAQSSNPALAAAAAANGLQLVSHVNSYTTVAARPIDGVLGRHLDQLLAANATGSIAQVLAQFQQLAPAQFSAAFQSLHPTVYGANTDTTFAITRQYTRTLQQRLEALRAGRPEEAAPQARAADSPFPLLAYNGSNASLGQVLGQDQAAWNTGRLGVWLEGFGQWGNQASINGFSGYNYGLAGTGAGMDYRFTKNLILGANFGYSYTNLNLDNGFGAGRINSLYGSLYGTWFTERAYVDGILSYGNHQYDNSRLINIGALQSINQSNHSGNAFALLVEGGYKFPVRHWTLQPFASLSYCNLSEGSVEESGGVANIQVKSRSNNSVVSELGVRLDRPIKTARGTLTPMVKVSWQHDFGVSQNNLPIAFVGAPIGVNITTPRTSQDSAVVRAGLTFKAKGGITSSIEYIGELGSQTQNQGVMGQIRLPF